MVSVVVNIASGDAGAVGFGSVDACDGGDFGVLVVAVVSEELVRSAGGVRKQCVYLGGGYVEVHVAVAVIVEDRYSRVSVFDQEVVSEHGGSDIGEWCDGFVHHCFDAAFDRGGLYDDGRCGW